VYEVRADVPEAVQEAALKKAALRWEQSSGHRTNLLRPNVTAIGVAMAKNKSGRAYWTLVLGAE
jgi:uncharacterized protein YkwD